MNFQDFFRKKSDTDIDFDLVCCLERGQKNEQHTVEKQTTVYWLQSNKIVECKYLRIIRNYSENFITWKETQKFLKLFIQKYFHGFFLFDYWVGKEFERVRQNSVVVQIFEFRLKEQIQVALLFQWTKLNPATIYSLLFHGIVIKYECHFYHSQDWEVEKRLKIMTGQWQLGWVSHKKKWFHEDGSVYVCLRAVLRAANIRCTPNHMKQSEKKNNNS